VNLGGLKVIQLFQLEDKVPNIAVQVVILEAVQEKVTGSARKTEQSDG